MTLTRKYGALEHDARQWADVSSALASAATVASSQLLSWEFSGVAEVAGTPPAYEQARSHLEFVLCAGAKEGERIADSLMELAMELGEVDRATAESFEAGGHKLGETTR